MDAITRLEKFLNGEKLEPITRKEKILAGEDIEPITRMEYFMKKAASGGGGDEPTGTISITADGTYDVTDYATATVNTKPAKGLVFSDYDSDGYPQKAEFVGTWTQIPDEFCNGVFAANPHKYTSYFYNLNKKIDSLTIPNGVTKIGYRAFRSCSGLKHINLPATLETLDAAFNGCVDLEEIIIPGLITTIVWGTFNNCYYLRRVFFLGSMVEIGQDAFGGSTLCELYDFSFCEQIPSLYSVNSLRHKSGCVIKVPQALLSDWQNETNWVGLTDVVWQGV